MTFRDVTVNHRKEALTRKVAQDLLATLPQQIRKRFITCFLDHTIPVSKKVLDYFSDNSEISYAVRKEPGSALPFENLYLKKAVSPIDRYFLDCVAGDQIYKRFQAIQRHLPKVINKEFNGQSLKLDNIGSGPGRDMIGILKKNNELAKKIHVRNIDPDANSLKIGQSLVETLKLESSFSFIPKQLNEVQTRNADILLVIGIFCSLKIRVCKLIFRGLEPFVSKGGIIIYSSAQKKMLMDDPLTDFIMDFHGWRMNFKTDEEAAEIASSRGWDVLTQFFDEPYRHHCMTVVRRGYLFQSSMR